jgi:hypothetical protein
LFTRSYFNELRSLNANWCVEDKACLKDVSINALFPRLQSSVGRLLGPRPHPEVIVCAALRIFALIARVAYMLVSPNALPLLGAGGEKQSRKSTIFRGNFKQSPSIESVANNWITSGDRWKNIFRFTAKTILASLIILLVACEDSSDSLPKMVVDGNSLPIGTPVISFRCCK